MPLGKSKNTEEWPFVAFCEVCGWQEGSETLEDAEIIAQFHQDDIHKLMDLTFYLVDEKVN